jgi:hypothetical protein
MDKRTSKIVAGIIFDFGAFLTGRKKKLVLSARHPSSPMVGAIEEFLIERKIEIKNAEVIHWEKEINSLIEENDSFKKLNYLEKLK